MSRNENKVSHELVNFKGTDKLDDFPPPPNFMQSNILYFPPSGFDGLFEWEEEEENEREGETSRSIERACSPIGERNRMLPRCR